MESKPSVWTVLHEGDIVCDSSGMIPCFASREGIEFFMDSMGMEEPKFEIREVAFAEVVLPPTTPFKIN